MALSKQTKEYLDSLPDDLFLAELWLRWGIVEPVWEECSQEEFEKNYGKTGTDTLTLEDIYRFTKSLFSGKRYKAVPFYKEAHCGVLFQMQEHTPDGYRYYKQVGEKKVLGLGGDMMEYCLTRDCMKPFFHKR